MMNILKKYRIVCEMSNFPNLSSYLTYNLSEKIPEYNDREKTIIEIINASFLDNHLHSSSNVAALIERIEDITTNTDEFIKEWDEKNNSKLDRLMGPKVSWNTEESYVDVYKHYTNIFNFYSRFEEEIPTSEILQLLKDWKVFLEEYYARAWGVPMDWIKPEYLDEAKKLQQQS